MSASLEATLLSGVTRTPNFFFKDLSISGRTSVTVIWDGFTYPDASRPDTRAVPILPPPIKAIRFLFRRLALAKESRPDTNQMGSFFNRHLKIMGHSHGKAGEFALKFALMLFEKLPHLAKVWPGLLGIL